jgi:hypothetical protein
MVSTGQTMGSPAPQYSAMARNLFDPSFEHSNSSSDNGTTTFLQQAQSKSYNNKILVYFLTGIIMSAYPLLPSKQESKQASSTPRRQIKQASKQHST